MAKEEFMLLSVKHTRWDDEYITMWKPNDHGYTEALEYAGTYTKLGKLHDTETNVAVLKSLVEENAVYPSGENYKKLPNNPTMWRRLCNSLDRSPFKLKE